MKIKKCLFLFVFIAFLIAGCSTKDDELSNGESYLIDYQIENSYTQTFYYAGRRDFISDTGGHKGNWYKSICNRLSFDLFDYDEGYTELTPSRDLTSSLEELNKDSKGKDHKYYLIANIYFYYEWYNYTLNEHIFKDLSLKSNWKIVIGKEQEYLFNGKVYNRLIVVEDYK